MPDSVTITDNRTGESYEVPIVYGTYPKGGAAISAMALRQIKVSDDSPVRFVIFTSSVNYEFSAPRALTEPRVDVTHIGGSTGTCMGVSTRDS